MPWTSAAGLGPLVIAGGVPGLRESTAGAALRRLSLVSDSGEPICESVGDWICRAPLSGGTVVLGFDSLSGQLVLAASFAFVGEGRATASTPGSRAVPGWAIGLALDGRQFCSAVSKVTAVRGGAGSGFGMELTGFAVSAGEATGFGSLRGRPVKRGQPSSCGVAALFVGVIRALNARGAPVASFAGLTGGTVAATGIAASGDSGFELAGVVITSAASLEKRRGIGRGIGTASTVVESSFFTSFLTIFPV